MELLRDKDEYGFDLGKVKHYANVYSSSTELRCILIDTSGKVLHDTGPETDLCKYCCRLQEDNTRLNCPKSRIYGSYQAERFGGKYVFFCPLGLVHWTSPIDHDGVMKGALLGGPVLMVEPDEFLLYNFIDESYNIPQEKRAELYEYINEVPIVKPERVNNLSEMLFVTAVHVSDVPPSKYAEEREYLEQQSDISEYMQYIKTMGGNIDQLQSYPIEKEKELLSYISIGDKAGSQKVLNEIFGHIFFSTGGNFNVIKARVLELIVLLSRAALEGGADVEQIFGLNYKYLGEIHGFKTIEELTFWLSKIMARFTDCVFNLTDIKHVDIIYKAVDYIKRNYMKKITLEEVANHVYLSDSYFSKIFKDEMKCNFNTYLNKLRIDMSKKLLMDNSISLVDISNLVGYEDQSYFSKVFKKLIGMSPGKYRESRGQQKPAQ